METFTSLARFGPLFLTIIDQLTMSFLFALFFDAETSIRTSHKGFDLNVSLSTLLALFVS